MKLIAAISIALLASGCATKMNPGNYGYGYGEMEPTYEQLSRWPIRCERAKLDVDYLRSLIPGPDGRLRAFITFDQNSRYKQSREWDALIYLIMSKYESYCNIPVSYR